jgi:Polysaccharide lyase
MRYRQINNTFLVYAESDEEAARVQTFLEPAPVPPVDPVPNPSSPPIFLHSFETSPTEDGAYSIQAKDRAIGARVASVSIGRHGGKAVRLRTLRGDIDVNGSGDRVRCDLSLGSDRTGNIGEGKEQWWAHSVYFPSEFQIPSGNWRQIFWQWHHSGSSGSVPYALVVQVINGRPCIAASMSGGQIGQNVELMPFFAGATPERNVWYDFVHHIVWRSGAGALAEIWARKGDEPAYRLQHRRTKPNLFAGQGMYLKPSNYHNKNVAQDDLYHDRIMLGASADSVRMAPLA